MPSNDITQDCWITLGSYACNLLKHISYIWYIVWPRLRSLTLFFSSAILASNLGLEHKSIDTPTSFNRVSQRRCFFNQPSISIYVIHIYIYKHNKLASHAWMHSKDILSELRFNLLSRMLSPKRCHEAHAQVIKIGSADLKSGNIPI